MSSGKSEALPIILFVAMAANLVERSCFSVVKNLATESYPSIQAEKLRQNTSAESLSGEI